MNKFLLVLLLLAAAGVSSYSLGNREEPSQKMDSEMADDKKSKKGEVSNEEGSDSIVISSADWDSAAAGEVVVVRGRLRLVGNEPFTELVLSDESDNQWYLDEDGRELVQSHEQRMVTVRGTVERKKMQLANGKSLPDKVILHDVDIVD